MINENEPLNEDIRIEHFEMVDYKDLYLKTKKELDLISERLPDVGACARIVNRLHNSYSYTDTYKNKERARAFQEAIAIVQDELGATP